MVAQSGHRSGRRLDRQLLLGQRGDDVAKALVVVRPPGVGDADRGLGHGAHDTVRIDPGPVRNGGARRGPRPSARGARARGAASQSAVELGGAVDDVWPGASVTLAVRAQASGQRLDDVEELGSLRRERGEGGLECPASGSRSSASTPAGSGASTQGVLAQDPQDAPAEDVVAGAEVREQVVGRPDVRARRGVQPGRREVLGQRGDPRHASSAGCSMISSTGRTGFAMSVSAGVVGDTGFEPVTSRM